MSSNINSNSNPFKVAQNLRKKSFSNMGGYLQNFISQILKIFVTLIWILEPIKHKI